MTKRTVMNRIFYCSGTLKASVQMSWHSKVQDVRNSLEHWGVSVLIMCQRQFNTCCSVFRIFQVGFQGLKSVTRCQWQKQTLLVDIWCANACRDYIAACDVSISNLNTKTSKNTVHYQIVSDQNFSPLSGTIKSSRTCRLALKNGKFYTRLSHWWKMKSALWELTLSNYGWINGKVNCGQQILTPTTACYNTVNFKTAFKSKRSSNCIVLCN